VNKLFITWMLGASALCGSVMAVAGEAASASKDPALEARVQAIAVELRCLVCQNQTIADSNAELAIDLRNQIRIQLQAGQSQDDILTYMTDRYGDFVRYRPPLKASTWLLWFGPLLLLGTGLLVLFVVLRKRSAQASESGHPVAVAPASAPSSTKEQP
jgi:cytochrome c-type biogenesis protein CcmH